jgi:copper chaperone CopZ
MYLVLKIPDMTCNHCKITIEKTLRKLNLDKIEIDLESKIVKIEGEVISEKIISEIIKAGYTPQTIE